jgi:hypothetical protein
VNVRSGIGVATDVAPRVGFAGSVGGVAVSALRVEHALTTSATFVAPSGPIFVASASPRSYWIDTGAHPSLREGPSRSVFRDYGSAVMYEPGKILVLGGGTTSAGQSESSAEIIDLNVASPAWTPIASMHYPRKQATATLLPDGRVLVTGGSQRGGDPSAALEDPGQPVLPAEMWDPATRAWTVLAAMSEARTYHSNALLLPDGRVLVNGGGQGGGPAVPDHPNADLFSPPYLSSGTRPTVTSAPATLHYGKAFSVASSNAASLGSVTLLRLGAVTHAFNENQRFNRLSFVHASSTSLTVTAPANANLAPPGHFLLFVLDTNGVPSVGRIVHLTN